MFGGRLGIPELLILFVIVGVFCVYIFGWAKVFSKAGYSGELCILMLIPLVNLITFIWFAFSEWPVRNAGASRAPGALI